MQAEGNASTSQQQDSGNAASQRNGNHRQPVEQIFAIASELYGRVAPRLARLFDDVADLYAGRWPSHEACAAPYHSLGHALDVSLALARMIAGWNFSEPRQPLGEEHFHLAMAAGLFHDAGYIKDKGDQEGHGGKFTLTHVPRGMEMARSHLAGQHWPEAGVEAVCRMISVTDYSVAADPAALFDEPLLITLARMVATADLVAQMADSSYLQRIDDLFAEFRESYEFEAEMLRKRGARVYKDVQEIRENTIAFYEQFVVPTLNRLGRMDRYLASYFGTGRNPYQENITANLSCHLLELQAHWRRLGNVLEDLGLASGSQIEAALLRQQERARPGSDNVPASTQLRGQLLPWFNSESKPGLCLGDILMEMGALSPRTLARGLLAQMLPPPLHVELSAAELHFLLQAAILLQNICRGPWILGVVMEMVNELLECEASSILIADLDEKEMVVTLPTGPRRHEVYGKRIPMDKGLAGWVYRNGQPAMVGNAQADERWDGGVDQCIDFSTRSILAVPIFVNGECVGALEMLNRRDDAFTRHHMNILTILANMLANVMAGLLCTRPA
ncbi:MAG: GAF domain-containing protein [Thermodesulfobacteriota bacterium]